MERDEVYVPKTRRDLGIPNAPQREIDWEEHFGDTPIYTLFTLVRQQLLAFPAYLRKSPSALRDVSAHFTTSMECVRAEGISALDEPL